MTAPLSKSDLMYYDSISHGHGKEFLEVESARKTGREVLGKIRESALRGESYDTFVKGLTPDQKKFFESQNIPLQKFWDVESRLCQFEHWDCYSDLKSALIPRNPYDRRPIVMEMYVGAPHSADLVLSVSATTYQQGETPVENPTFVLGLAIFHFNGGDNSSNWESTQESDPALEMDKAKFFTQKLIFENLMPYLPTEYLRESFTGDRLSLIESFKYDTLSKNGQKKTTMTIHLKFPIDESLREQMLANLAKTLPGGKASYIVKEDQHSVVIEMTEENVGVFTYSPADPDAIPGLITGEILSNVVEQGDFEFYRWIDADGRPPVDDRDRKPLSVDDQGRSVSQETQAYFMDFKSLKIQDDYLARIVYFTEMNPGVVLSPDRSGVITRPSIVDEEAGTITLKRVPNMVSAIARATI